MDRATPRGYHQLVSDVPEINVTEINGHSP
jgi:hypothetical protein